MITTKLLIACR